MRKVVFLPCSPNMWDGFETLYDKEVSDPSTQVTVIPIPCYSKKHDGSLTDTSYELTGYPDNVTITGVNDYNLAAEHPNTIYVQNIQDSDNPGFTVHPEFYTDKLRACTDELVYVPYNCFSEVDPGYEFLVKNYMPILCTKGIFNTDRIIVQSENTKNVYLRLLDAKGQPLDVWDKKISFEEYPRKEILKKYTRETVNFPASWDRHLFGSDDYQKDTVLFVTSVMGVLEFGRDDLLNAKAVFDEFLEKKEENALIWRPHKSLPEVIAKLRPELFDDFKALLEYYLYNDIGIFDDTPSPTPAILISDYYYGDECGIKELFKSTGKPILQ